MTMCSLEGEMAPAKQVRGDDAMFPLRSLACERHCPRLGLVLTRPQTPCPGPYRPLIGTGRAAD